MNIQQSRLLSQQLLEMLELSSVDSEFAPCKKKNCCKKYKKGKNACKKCPVM